jgi:hypothetical protein
LALRAIRERQVECVERVREITAEPFAVGDNGIELSKAIFHRALLAREQILRLVPFFLEKYKDQVETQANKNPLHQARPRQRLEQVEGRVDLPPAKALAGAALIGVVIVVPAFAHGEQRQQPVVARVVTGDIAPAAAHMRQRIDAEGRVPDQHRGLVRPRGYRRSSAHTLRAKARMTTLRYATWLHPN